MNAITTIEPPQPTGLMDPATFEHMQRVGKMLSLSPLFPEHLRKGGDGVGLANAVLTLNMALRLREDVLTVAQNIYFVGGKPGWSASYMIAKANQHGVFREPIDWEETGEGDNLTVTAFVHLAASGARREVKISMANAKLEGWTSNKKYQTMPAQMLRYRTATALIRLYCPEVMVGVPPANELEDQQAAETMRDVTPKPPAAATVKPAAAPKPKPEPVVEEAEVVGPAGPSGPVAEPAAPPISEDAKSRRAAAAAALGAAAAAAQAKAAARQAEPTGLIAEPAAPPPASPAPEPVVDADDAPPSFAGLMNLIRAEWRASPPEDAAAVFDTFEEAIADMERENYPMYQQFIHELTRRENGDPVAEDTPE